MKSNVESKLVPRGTISIGWVICYVSEVYDIFRCFKCVIITLRIVKEKKLVPDTFENVILQRAMKQLKNVATRLHPTARRIVRRKDSLYLDKSEIMIALRGGGRRGADECWV